MIVSGYFQSGMISQVTKNALNSGSILGSKKFISLKGREDRYEP
jgi:hypothetical protein